MSTEHCFWTGNTHGMRHRKYKCNIWHWFRQICSALVLDRFASTLVIRTRSKLNRCETTSRRWFSWIRIKSLIRISWYSVNARKGAKPVSLRIKSASGVLLDSAAWNVQVRIHNKILTNLRYRGTKLLGLILWIPCGWTELYTFPTCQKKHFTFCPVRHELSGVILKSKKEVQRFNLFTF